MRKLLQCVARSVISESALIYPVTRPCASPVGNVGTPTDKRPVLGIYAQANSKGDAFALKGALLYRGVTAGKLLWTHDLAAGFYSGFRRRRQPYLLTYPYCEAGRSKSSPHSDQRWHVIGNTA